MDHNGKASKPNLAIIVLLAIILIQAVFLIRAYAPKEKVRPRPVKVSAPPRPGHPPKPAPYPPVGKIAIIIDDSGYNIRDCEHLAEIKAPVTISILPQLKYSGDIAECAHDQGKDVMLHLPLEPHVMREKYPETYFIRTDLGPSAILSRFRIAFDSVPHAVGVNNHEGSKATEDTRVMTVLFREFRKKGLFFVDSLVTGRSVCGTLAEKEGIPFTERDVFLDNVAERSAIEAQFRELAAKARQRGTAVAIGHARPLSWEVMKDQIKKLQNQGYEFVAVQEIIKSQGH